MNFIITHTKEKINTTTPILIGLVLFLLFFFLPLLTYNHTDGSGDLGKYLQSPVRIIFGDLPYRDFWLILPPGEVFFPYFIYKIFGLNINMVLIFSIVINAAIGFFSFLLGAYLLKNNLLAIVVAFLVFFSGTPARYATYTYPHIYLLFTITSVLLFLRSLKNSKNPGLFWAGLFIGIAFFFRFYEVGAAFLAAVLTIFFYSKITGRMFPEIIKSLGIFCMGTFLVFMTLLPVFRGICQPMLREVLKESACHAIILGKNFPYFLDVRLRLDSFLIHLHAVVRNESQFFAKDLIISFYELFRAICFSIPFLLPFFIVAILPWYLKTKEPSQYQKIVFLFFSLWGISSLPKALSMSDLPRIAFSITPLFVPLVILLQRLSGVTEKNRTTLGKIIFPCVGIITALLLLRFPFSILRTVKDLVKDHYPVSTNYGTLLLENKSEADDINSVIAAIRKYTEEGDYIFVVPEYAPPLYALTKRRNSTYYDSFHDLFARPTIQKQQGICRDLLTKNTNLIVYYSDQRKGTFVNHCALVDKCIKDNFQPIDKTGDLWMYISKK